MQYLSLFIILAYTAFLSRFIWSGNREGERLFYTAMGLVVGGPFVFFLVWADAFTSFSIEAVSPTASVLTFFVMVFVYPLITAIIGESFGL